MSARMFDLADKITGVLDREYIELNRDGIKDISVAISLVMAQFVLLVEESDKGISDGIDAMAGDAKEAARKLRGLR